MVLSILEMEVADKKVIEHETSKREINFRYFSDNYVGITLDETTSSEDVNSYSRFLPPQATEK